jgi:hypothetical protein
MTMVIKPQDIVVLCKLIAYQKAKKGWSQNSLASELCLSPSQINLALKRLVIAGLVTPYRAPQKPQPIIQACIELFIYGLKYMFPAKLGEIARGIRTSYAAPSFKGEVSLGREAIPVWPYGNGEDRGVALKPLYSNVPKAVIQYPDPLFYDILTLLDAIRSGRAREKQIAIQNLSKILESKTNEKPDNV